MKKINIQINNAKIMSYEVELEEEMPQITATIGLFAGKKKISTFSLSTKSWHEVRFNLPLQIINPIKEIADKLEHILILSCSQSMGMIEAPKKFKKQ